jgi:hypothetical protein
MNTSQLLDLIAAGESEAVEFKRELDRAERLCRENGIREPDFALVGDEVVVTLYSRRYEEFHGTATHD